MVDMFFMLTDASLVGVLGVSPSCHLRFGRLPRDRFRLISCMRHALFVWLLLCGR